MKCNNPYKLNLDLNFMKHHLISAEKKALEKFARAIDYFNHEISILESIGYTDSERFLSQFPERAKDFILGVNRNKNYYSELEGFPQNVRDSNLVERDLYLSRVVDHLKRESKSPKYAPAQGSFWESIGQTLEKLAAEVQEKL